MKTLSLAGTVVLVVLTASLPRRAEAESCLGVDRVPRPGLKPTITVDQSVGAGKRRVLVTVHFVNVGPSSLHLEKWLAFQPPVFSLDVFQILRSDGRPVRYVGRRLCGGGPPRAADFLVLPARAQHTIRGIDITDAFEFPPTPQTLTIRYQATSVSGGRVTLVESDGVTLNYVP